MNKTPCFKDKRNLSPLNHLGDFVWNISWREIQRITNISSGHTCQTDSDPNRNEKEAEFNLFWQKEQ
jgi:hypothetical protein